ncbi:hypothetical protein HC928_02535 [bacterium]|nr:hypothetical protein [bacterium]
MPEAIAAAVADGATNTSPRVVLVKPGTYVGDIVGADGVHIQSVESENIPQAAVATRAVILDGTVTLSSGTFLLNGIHFARTTGSIFSLEGGNLLLSACRISQTNGTTFVFSTTAPKTVRIIQSLLSGDATSTLFSHDASNAFCSFAASNSRFIYVDVVNSFAGAAGSFNFEFNECTVQGSFSIGVPTANVLWEVNAIVGDGTNPILTTGASTTGTIQSNGNSYNSAGQPLFSIGNSGMSYDRQFDRWDSGGAVNVQASGTTTLRSFFIKDDAIHLSGTKAGFFGSDWITSQSVLQTPSNTTTTLASVVVNEGESILLKANVVGSTATHGASVGGDVFIVARRASAGNVTIVGAAVPRVETSSAATFTADVDTGTQTVRIRVTGVAATVYNWICTYSYQKVLTNA